ncbi:MAG: metallophosphoesterase [Actinomycetota bacterium]|jgi:DNA repair protein SbcD/Mre11|nr:metallophosphoesterase [Actinomycetota bacterium]
MTDLAGRELKMLHTSDVHIGYVAGTEGDHHDVCQCPIHALLDAVVQYEVDLLMVAGDLFDHGRLQASTVGATLDLLGSSGVPVVIIPGNHDVHDEASVWQRCRPEVDRSGVLLLDDHAGTTIDLFDGALHIWGKAMAEHEPGYRPLADVPGRPSEGWFVVAGHGHLNLTPDDRHRSSPITHDEIGQTDADYVALGHWHVTTDASHNGVPAWYPGTPMGKPGNSTAALVTFGAQVAVEHVGVGAPVHGCYR